MSITTITVGANTVNLVATPGAPGFRDITLIENDTVGVVRSPFTGLTQTQSWPGADYWGATVTLPPMPRAQAAAWKAMLSELRGMANAILIGDQSCPGPLGHPSGAPVANTAGGTGWNAAATTTLYTRGWKPSTFRLLLPDDYLQLGYRLHKVCDQVNSDEDGDAAISIWPSIRELPADGTPIILANPRGLFRLASNKRQWQTTNDFLTTMSMQLTEYR
jgi:hypothetical protein